MAAEAQKQVRRSNERDWIEKELKAKNSEINELKEEIEKIKNVMALMKDELEIAVKKAESYQKKIENSMVVNRKNVGTSPRKVTNGDDNVEIAVIEPKKSSDAMTSYNRSKGEANAIEEKANESSKEEIIMRKLDDMTLDDI